MAKNEEKKPAGTEQVQPPAAEQQTPPPIDDQQGETAEANAVTIRSLHEMIMELGRQLTDAVNWIRELEQKVHAAGEPVLAAWSSTTEQLSEPQIEFDHAWLDGLVYKGSEEVKPEDGQNGRKVKRFQPFERKAEMGDVLSWKVDGDSVTIVLADGSKYQVER